MKLTAKILFFATIYLCSAQLFGRAGDDNKIGGNGDSDLNGNLMSIILIEKVIITDLSGNIIKETSTDDDYALENLPSGSYIINILDDAGNITQSSFYIK